MGAAPDAVGEVRRAVRALRLAVPAAVADDVAARVEAALAQAWDEGERHESDYLATWGQFCPLRICNPYRPGQDPR